MAKVSALSLCHLQVRDGETQRDETAIFEVLFQSSPPRHLLFPSGHLQP